MEKKPADMGKTPADMGDPDIFWPKNVVISDPECVIIRGISAEICQLIEIIPGTYDNLDLAFCICGSFIPFYIFLNQKTRRIK